MANEFSKKMQQEESVIKNIIDSSSPKERGAVVGVLISNILLGLNKEERKEALALVRDELKYSAKKDVCLVLTLLIPGE